MFRLNGSSAIVGIINSGEVLAAADVSIVNVRAPSFVARLRVADQVFGAFPVGPGCALGVSASLVVYASSVHDPREVRRCEKARTDGAGVAYHASIFDRG